MTRGICRCLILNGSHRLPWDERALREPLKGLEVTPGAVKTGLVSFHPSPSPKSNPVPILTRCIKDSFPVMPKKMFKPLRPENYVSLGERVVMNDHGELSVITPLFTAPGIQLDEFQGRRIGIYGDPVAYVFNTGAVSVLVIPSMLEGVQDLGDL